MKTGIVLCVIALLMATGCTSVGRTLKGTDTAPIRISLGRDGTPRVDIATVVVKVGQRVVFVGPEEFTIDFPQDTPFNSKRIDAENAVINLVVPEQVRGKAQSGAKTIKFKYDVIVNGKRLDPHMIVIL